MRKYGKWLLMLGVLAARPAGASADGFLGGRFSPAVPFSGSAEKARNTAKAQEVAAAMRQAEIQGSDIEIEVKDRVAILHGKVSDASQLALAARAAASVDGIDRVENNLRSVPPAEGRVERASAETTAETRMNRVAQAAAAFDSSDSRRGSIQRVNSEVAPAQPDNQQIAQQIADSLARAGFDGLGIEIRFKDGTATLSGEVATVGQRQAAASVVSQIPSVRSVSNQLKVAGPINPASFGPHTMPMAAGQPHMVPPQMVQAGYMQPAIGMDAGMPPSAAGYAPTSFNNPHLPNYAWPAYAQYPNSAAVSYPTQYSASAWPYIGPFYPYPQVPMGWREVSLQWDDGYWQLKFNQEQDKWYWVLNPKNW